MMTNLMTILERKAFISSNPRIVLSSCPPPCGHFSIQESATGGLSYKVKKGDGHPSPIQISYLFQLSNCFLSNLSKCCESLSIIYSHLSKHLSVNVDVCNFKASFNTRLCFFFAFNPPLILAISYFPPVRLLLCYIL